MDGVTLRAELGLHHSQWNAAGAFGIFLQQIENLSEREDMNAANEDKELASLSGMLYTILFRGLGRDLLDKKRQSLWLFGRYPPMHKYHLPAKFDTIRIVPWKHYLCFYDDSPQNQKRKYISKLNIIDPKDRQRLYDIRFSMQNVRRRLLRYHCKKQSWDETILQLKSEGTAQVTTVSGETVEGEQDIKMVEGGEMNGEDSQVAECSASTPSKSVAGIFQKLNISGTAMDETL